MAKKQKKFVCGAFTLACFLSYVQSPCKQPKRHQEVLDHILCADPSFFLAKNEHGEHAWSAVWSAWLVLTRSRQTHAVYVVDALQSLILVTYQRMHMVFDAKTLDSLVAREINQLQPRHCRCLASESDMILQCIGKLRVQKNHDDGKKELTPKGDESSLPSRLYPASEHQSTQSATLSDHTLWEEDDDSDEWVFVDACTS